MTKIDVFNQKGEKTTQVELSDKIFNTKKNDDLIYQAIVTQLGNARHSNAHTKTRGEVAGGGIKPWKQKGTGRARAGDIRPPHWIGGGVAFGPRNTKNYCRKLPKKMRKAALAIALGERLSQKRILVLDNLEFTDAKTREAQKMLTKLPITEGSVLIITETNNLKANLSFRNLPYVKLININNINIYDISKFDWIIFTSLALSELEKSFLGKSNTTEVKNTIIPEIAKKKVETKAKTSEK